jgi:uncharacterized membrane protein YgcG
MNPTDFIGFCRALLGAVIMNRPMTTGLVVATVSVAWRASHGAPNTVRFLAVPPNIKFPQAERLGSHLWKIPQFLTEREVAHLRAIGEASTKMMKMSSSYESVEFRRPWERSSDPIANAIEDRIGNLSGIAANPKDSPLRLSVSRPWVHAQVDDGARSQLQNLHHDKIQAAERVLTCLLYLSDATSDGLRGGETLFPCARPASSVTPLCDRLERAFSEGDLFLSPPGGIHRSLNCFDAEAAAAASDLCAASHRGGSSSSSSSSSSSGGGGGGSGSGRDSSSSTGSSDTISHGDGLSEPAADDDGVVRVIPERGTALLFLHEAAEVGGGALTRSAWHGGCRVHAAAKWTMQQFKVLPSSASA